MLLHDCRSLHLLFHLGDLVLQADHTTVVAAAAAATPFPVIVVEYTKERRLLLLLLLGTPSLLT